MTQKQIETIKALDEWKVIRHTNSRGYKAILEKVQGKYNVIMNANGIIEESDFDKPISAVVFAGIQ